MYHHHHYRRLWSSSMSKYSILHKGVLEGYRRRQTIAAQMSPFLIGSGMVYSSSSSSTNNNNNNNRLRLSGGGGGGSGMTTKRGFPQGIPWLFLSPTDNGNILPVFNPRDRCFYDIPIPKDVQGRHISVRGSGYGWLVMVKSNLNGYGHSTETIITLYNPITRIHIPLPSLPPKDVVGNPQLWYNPTSSTTNHGQPLISITLGFRNPQILIYHQGNDCWSEIETPPGYQVYNTLYHDADAALYVTDYSGRLSVLDLIPSSTTLRPLIDNPSPEINSLRGSPRLMVGAGGDLLLVKENWPKYEHPQFDVFKMDRRCLEWARTECIGNNTLFVHNKHAVSMALCHPDFTDAQANQIYIFKQYRTRLVGNHQEKLTDTKFITEMPADVQVLDLIAAAANSPSDQREQLLFKTKNILREGPYWYQQFAAWMVPSLS